MPLTKRKLRRLPKVRRQYVTIARPAQGLNVDDQSTMIDDRQSPDCHEMLFEDGSFRKAYGWSPFGYTDVATALVGRLTVRKTSSKALVCRMSTNTGNAKLVSKVTVTQGFLTKSLVCTVTVTS